MLTRLGTPVMSGVVALAMALAMGGMVVGVALVADTTPAETEVTAPAAPDTTATFEDTDGNGVDDDCQQAVEANAEAEASAATAVDLDKDGIISTSEAAQSDRVGGKNCNHGGYVSGVSKADHAGKPDKDDKAAAKAERAAAKAERAADKAAAKAERAAAKAERAAAKANRQHGKAP